MNAAVLLAESEAATREFLQRHLADDGFDVLGASPVIPRARMRFRSSRHCRIGAADEADHLGKIEP